MSTHASGPTPATTGMVHPDTTRLWTTAVVLSLFAAAMWFAWLGWDHQFYEVDGVAQGPHRPWQVIGCGLAIATGAVLAYLRVPQTATIFVLATAADIGFAVPWAVDASNDDTGMWAVGLIFLAVGSGVGLTVLLAITNVVAGSRSASGGSSPASSGDPRVDSR